MDSPPETLCFVENSRAWQEGQIKLDVYFGNMAEHFNGTRHHPGDNKREDKVLFYLDRIGHSIQDCLWDASLKPVKDTKPLGNLLATRWRGQLPELKAQYENLAASSEYAAAACLLLPTMIYITCFRHYTAMLQYCLSVSNNPSLMLSSHPSINLLVVEERANPEIWDILLGAGWYADKKAYLIDKATDIRGLRGSRLLKAVISNGAEVSTPMLGKAARYGDGQSFKILLEHFTPNQMDNCNALGMAAISYFDSIDKMDMLLEKGADINFITAAKFLDPDFLQAEREYYTWGRFEGTALHLAAEWGLEDVVKWLLEKGARADLKDSGGNYAMQRAEKADHLEVRDVILAALEKQSKEN